MSELRILLAEDHNLVRAGLRSLLESFDDMKVVGEASNGNEALQQIEELQPDIVLMDVAMPDLNGIEATRRAARAHSRTRVVMLSMHGAHEYVRQALLAGAAGYVLKSAESGELETAVRAVARGEHWLSPAISRIAIAAFVNDGSAPGDAAHSTGRLTARQREVLQLIAEGHSTKDIGRLLHVSVKTVESHRAQLMERLDIHDVAGLVLYAVRTGIVHPDK